MKTKFNLIHTLLLTAMVVAIALTSCSVNEVEPPDPAPLIKLEKTAITADTIAVKPKDGSSSQKIVLPKGN